MRQRIIYIALLLLLAAGTANAQRYGRANWWNTPPEKWQFFAGADVAFPETGMKNLAYGINVGYVKNFGGYAHILFNGSPKVKDNKFGVTSTYDMADYYFMTNKYAHTYQAIMAGGMLRLWCPLYLHVGAGYVREQIAYQHMNGDWITIGEASERDYDGYDSDGIGIEAGLSLRINNILINSNVILAYGGFVPSFGLSYCF